MGHLYYGRLSVNLRRGFSVGYFHVKSVPELADAESTWDIFMPSQFLSLPTQNQRGIVSYQVSMLTFATTRNFSQLLELPYAVDIYFDFRMSVS